MVTERSRRQIGRKLPAQHAAATRGADCPIVNDPGALTPVQHGAGVNRGPIAGEVPAGLPEKAAEMGAGAYSTRGARRDSSLPPEGLLRRNHRGSAVDLQCVMRERAAEVVAL